MLLLSVTVLSLVIAGSLSQPPPPEPTKPVLPATFEAEVGVEYHEEESQGVQFGDGYLLSDYEGNMAKEYYNLSEHEVSRFRHVMYLQRYDMERVYEVNSQEPTDCHSHNVTGHLPDFWGFVKDADYAGQRTFHERQLDCWVLRLSFGVELEVCTDAEEQENRPILFRRHTPEIEVFMEFRTFNTTQPTASSFVVPPECQELSPTDL